MRERKKERHTHSYFKTHTKETFENFLFLSFFFCAVFVSYEKNRVGSSH